VEVSVLFLSVFDPIRKKVKNHKIFSFEAAEDDEDKDEL